MPEQLQFTISSELKNIIGKELITDDFIAIFELVKNSYDANAKKVDIIFKHIKKKSDDNPAKIFVIDNGDGMSYSDLKTKWLVVGYSWKKEQEKELTVKLTPIKWEPINPEIKNKKPTKREQPYG